MIQKSRHLPTVEVPHRDDTETVDNDGWVDTGQIMATSLWKSSGLLNFAGD